MNDLHDALNKAIRDYVYVDTLPVRKQKKVKDIYGKFEYNYDAVTSLIEFEEALETLEEELENLDEEE
jgi:hypothetical protein